MDLKVERLSQGEKVAAVAALALFACMFLSWFNFGFFTWTAWEGLHFIAPLLAITIFTTLGCTFATLSARDLGDLPAGMLVFVLGGLAALLVLFRVIDPVSLGGEGGSTSASVEAGAFLGLIAAIGVAFGGYLQTDGEALEKLRRLVPSGAAAGAGATPPPPPPPGGAGPVQPPPTPPPPAAASAEPPALAAPSLPPLEVSPADPAAVAPAASAAEPAAAEAFCEHCGSPMRAQDQFCRKCGQRQSELPQSGQA
jgi:hypothetical protein